MKLLSEAAAATMVRLDHMENEARKLISELDSLDIRLHRAFTAVCIDSYVADLNAERNRMLEDEKQAETNADLTRLPALGVYGLLSLSRRQKPDWDRAASSILRKEPFGDIRIAASDNETKLINVSAIARERGISATEVVTYLEQEGYKVFNWPEFQARADDLRMAGLRGEAAHLGLERATLEGLSSITA